MDMGNCCYPHPFQLHYAEAAPNPGCLTPQIGGALVHHSWQKKPAANLALPSFQFQFFSASLGGRVFERVFLHTLPKTWNLLGSAA